MRSSEFETHPRVPFFWPMERADARGVAVLRFGESERRERAASLDPLACRCSPFSFLVLTVPLSEDAICKVYSVSLVSTFAISMVPCGQCSPSFERIAVVHRTPYVPSSVAHARAGMSLTRNWAGYDTTYVACAQLSWARVNCTSHSSKSSARYKGSNQGDRVPPRVIFHQRRPQRHYQVHLLRTMSWSLCEFWYGLRSSYDHIGNSSI